MIMIPMIIITDINVVMVYDVTRKHNAISNNTAKVRYFAHSGLLFPGATSRNKKILS
jgi:hypothetical protein